MINYVATTVLMDRQDRRLASMWHTEAFASDLPRIFLGFSSDFPRIFLGLSSHLVSLAGFYIACEQALGLGASFYTEVEPLPRKK